MNEEETILIPELCEWNNGNGITLEAWISGVGRFDHALGYASLFWPGFIQYEHCVLRTAPDDANFQKWMENMGGDHAKVEAMMNHLHLVDLFVGSEYLPNKPLLLRLGQLLKEMWTCKLALDFPLKHFEIELDLDKADISELELTFFQSPSGSKK